MTLAAGRRIRRVRLTAAREEDAARAATLLADAFRTASLPGADEARSVVIRRLALGRISSQVSPATLALHIEQAAARAAAEAVSFDLPAAASAGAVTFPDRAKPLIALARLHARNAPTDAWFWHSVVPHWATCVGRAERWLLLLDAAHELPEAAIVAAAIVHEAAVAGVESELLAAIPSGRAGAWLRSAGWSSYDVAQRLPGVVERRGIDPTIMTLPCGIEAIDDRVVWLNTLLAVHAAPPRAADPALPGRIASALWRAPARERSSRSPITERKEAPPLESRRRRLRIDPDADTSRNGTFTTVADREHVHPPTRADSDLARDRRAMKEEPASPANPATDQAPAGYFTPYGGLFLVVAILARLRIAAFLSFHSEHLESGFPTRLLWFIGSRFGLSADDPLATAVREGSLYDPPLRFSANEPMPLCEVWYAAVRQWCNRRARLTLKDIVCRPARVRITQTHVEVAFDLSALDTRVRRLALDVDPGWVPWLGRVVQFHYHGHDDAGH